MNFYVKIIFSLIFLLSTLFTQSQRGSNITSDSEGAAPSISGNGQVIVVKNGSSVSVYAWNGSGWVRRFNAVFNEQPTSSVDIDYDGSTVIVGFSNTTRVFQWNG